MRLSLHKGETCIHRKEMITKNIYVYRCILLDILNIRQQENCAVFFFGFCKYSFEFLGIEDNKHSNRRTNNRHNQVVIVNSSISLASFYIRTNNNHRRIYSNVNYKKNISNKAKNSMKSYFLKIISYANRFARRITTFTTIHSYTPINS